MNYTQNRIHRSTDGPGIYITYLVAALTNYENQNMKQRLYVLLFFYLNEICLRWHATMFRSKQFSCCIF